MFATDDTIVAVSSAAGPAGRSIVRLSGPDAAALAEKVFSRPLAGVGGFRALDGVAKVLRPYPIACPARLYLFRGPRSYTRQDVVELHVPGEVVAAAVLSALIEGGARQASAGEFTARAFLSGRLDLASAEAVADVIDAEADAQLRSAVAVLSGAVAGFCRPAAEKLTQVLATVEAGLDFSDQDIAPASPADLAGSIASVAEQLGQAVASAAAAPADHLPRVAIAGRPNVGKSSLLNALSRSERTIVSAMAGTTRDVLSAPALLPGGGQVVLLDAAGLDDSPDPLARAAGAAARRAVASAEAVLFVIDAADGDLARQQALLEEVRNLNARAPLLTLANKMDLPVDRPRRLTELRARFGADLLAGSALTGEGLPELLEAIQRRLSDLAAPQTGKLLLHDRQRRALSGAIDAARTACLLLEASRDASDQAELVAVELRAALARLGEVTGQVATEDVLAAIFARFCIGK